MANQRWIGKRAFDDVVDVIRQQLQQGSISCELTHQVYHLLDDTKIAFLTFEKYFLRNSSRTSMSVLIVERDDTVTVDAAASGGGESLLFKFDWGSSNNFIGQLDRILTPLGLRAKG